MKNNFFNFKVESLLSSREELKDSLRKIFVKITSDLEEIIFSSNIIYLSCNNKNIGNLIYEQFLELGLKLSKIEETNANFSKVGSLIFPLPEHPEIYDIIYFFREENQQ